ncbi:SIR2 family protein [Candidatus Spongiihabitans sp.]|uniref:SIR2 family protein n=1 Tax=Candidatus Spongiihabitans sp. TaxID=3101308 RepID=UPI003C6F2C1A
MTNKINQSEIFYYQGTTKQEGDNDTLIDKIKSKVYDLTNLKNVNFLLGAGASSPAIPTMQKMQTDFSEIASESKLYAKFPNKNLEVILGKLYSAQNSTEIFNDSNREKIKNLTTEIKEYIIEKTNIDVNADTKGTLSLYKKFYQKIALRNKDLARINIFTTNYDLLNERALDYLNINFNNGFGGGLERTFNPARFNYTLSRKIDINLEKFEPIENLIYLYKLHGSISWIENIENKNSLFHVQEIPISPGTPSSTDSIVLIYPTPSKQSQSLGSPYSDLLREFQKKLSLPNSVLFVIGYSFSDPHINNIIYQSLASNSSITLMIFGEYAEEPLRNIDDSRIYHAFGRDGKEIHYFEYIVENFLQNLDENKNDNLLKEFVGSIKTELNKRQGDEGRKNNSN